ncbi:polysaccharide deacetylase family protein [Mycoplasmatota bacterium WC44]
MLKEFLIVSVTIFYVSISLIINYQDFDIISTNDLYNDIKLYSLEVDQEPVNARCDKVWYKVPGLKGRIVDIDASYNNMSQFDENKVIYQVIKPEVVMDDLECGPIYRGNENKKSITLIVNVAWGTEFIVPMLDIFDEYGVLVNFFIEGKWANKNMELVYEIYNRGHLVGNHSYSHPNLANSEANKIKYELSKTNNIISNITMDSVNYFGPPSGAYDQEVIDIAKELNMETVLWTVDTIDWQKPSERVIINRVLSKIHSGGIILMHPTKNTVLALDDIIEATSKDYKIERLDLFLQE